MKKRLALVQPSLTNDDKEKLADLADELKNEELTEVWFVILCHLVYHISSQLLARLSWWNRICYSYNIFKVFQEIYIPKNLV